MSPASTRRYIVGFESWTMYEAVVLASSKRETIAKGKALYNLNGLREFLRQYWRRRALARPIP
jgi:hypothetical protein